MELFNRTEEIIIKSIGPITVWEPKVCRKPHSQQNWVDSNLKGNLCFRLSGVNVSCNQFIHLIPACKSPEAPLPDWI